MTSARQNESSSFPVRPTNLFQTYRSAGQIRNSNERNKSSGYVDALGIFVVPLFSQQKKNKKQRKKEKHRSAIF